MERPITTKNVGQPCVICGQAADAQATIAALQARVKELEESRDAWRASQECSEKAYMALVNQIPAERFDYDPINVALLDGAKEQEIIGRKQIADLQSQLTQRTAELEALRKWRDYVTVALQRPGGAFFEDVPKHIIDLVAELAAVKQQLSAAQETILRTYTASAALDLVGVKAELERVRGLIVEYAKAKTDFDEKRLQEDHYAGKERYNRLVEAENALLQHRQGMEG